jgi:nucleotide-binding universal stress UspA family protein
VTENAASTFIVVGVTPRQPDTVLRYAARFARHFGAQLVCAHVDPSTFVVEEHPDGSVTTRPIDADLPEWVGSQFDPALADRLTSLAQAEGVPVTFRQLAGDVAHALSRLGDVLSAEMIIVGSHRPGFWSTMQDFFGGSVAAHLAHRQHRPVVVVPLSPVPFGDRLPWQPLPS